MRKEEILSRINVKSFYLSELPSLKANNSGIAQALCPFHEDRKPSLSLNLQHGRFRCFGCDEKGSIFDFYMKKYDVDFRSAKDALAEIAGLLPKPERKIARTYDYTDESGNLLFQTVRYDPKDFRQRRPGGNGNWIYNLKGVKLVPYNLTEVIKSESVIIVEGEKDADSLNGLGFTASCNPMGVGKWKHEYSAHFKDKEVVVIPDNDEPGKKHAENVAKNLQGVAKSVKFVELPDLPEKGDVTDWLKLGGSKKDLEQIIETTPLWEIQTEKLFCVMGLELVEIEIKIEWLIEKLIPLQSITLLHGRGGVGKTWLSLNLANAVSKGLSIWSLSTRKVPVYYVDFENSLPVLSERVKKIDATDVRFVHPGITVPPPRLDSDDWIKYKELEPGLLIFDTLRASQSLEENSSKEMAIVMNQLKELRDMGFTILLLHHTPKADDMKFKGSSVISDLSDHTLRLYKEGKGYKLETGDKSRYEPFGLMLDFDPGNGGFVSAEERYIEDVWNLIRTYGPINKTDLSNRMKDELELSNYSTTSELLEKGKGVCWTVSKGAKNATIYEAIAGAF